MTLYLIIYSIIFLIFLSFSVKLNKLFHVSIVNFFVLAHLILFLISPLLFGQYNILESTEFQLISILSLLGIFFGSSFNIRVYKSNLRFVPKLKAFKMVFFIFLFASVLKIREGILNFGLDKILLSQQNELQGRGLMDIILQLTSFVSMFYFGFLFKSNIKKFIIYYFIFFVSIVLTSAHRTPVVITFITPFLVHLFLKNQGKIKKVFVFVGFFLVVNIMLIMNFFRQGILNELNYDSQTLTSVAISNSLSGLNTSKNLFDLIDNKYEKEYLSKIHYLLLGFVPRKIYKNKPIVSFNMRTTEKLKGYKVGSFKGADILTFTVPGEGFVQFSYFGAFLFSFLSVLIVKLTVRFLLRFGHVEFILINFIFSIFIFYRSAFDSIFFNSIYTLIYLCLLIPFFKIGKPKNQNFSSINLQLLRRLN